MLTKTELVDAFIEHSLRQQKGLLSNQTFSAESLYGLTQLASHQDGILLRVSLTQESIEFHLRQDTPQTAFLQKLQRYKY